MKTRELFLIGWQTVVKTSFGFLNPNTKIGTNPIPILIFLFLSHAHPLIAISYQNNFWKSVRYVCNPRSYTVNSDVTLPIVGISLIFLSSSKALIWMVDYPDLTSSPLLFVYVLIWSECRVRWVICKHICFFLSKNCIFVMLYCHLEMKHQTAPLSSCTSHAGIFISYIWSYNYYWNF